MAWPSTRSHKNPLVPAGCQCEKCFFIIGYLTQVAQMQQTISQLTEQCGALEGALGEAAEDQGGAKGLVVSNCGLNIKNRKQLSFMLLLLFSIFLFLGSPGEYFLCLRELLKLTSS